MIERIASAVLVSCAVFAVGAARAGEETVQLKDAPGRDVTVGRCVTCHSVDYIPMNAAVMDRAGWLKTIRKMVDRLGAPVTEEEATQILEYLSTHYTVAVNDAT